MAAPVSTLTVVDIIVAGPMLVQASLNGADWLDFGMADSETLPEWVEQEFIHQVKTSSSGQGSEQEVHQGLMGALAFTLVKYKVATLASIKAQQRGAADAATIGRLLTAVALADSFTFGLRYIPTTTGRTGIKFPRCFASGDAWRESNFGVVERRLGGNIIVKPDPTTGKLWVLEPNA